MSRLRSWLIVAGVNLVITLSKNVGGFEMRQICAALKEGTFSLGLCRHKSELIIRRCLNNQASVH